MFLHRHCCGALYSGCLFRLPHPNVFVEKHQNNIFLTFIAYCPPFLLPREESLIFCPFVSKIKKLREGPTNWALTLRGEEGNPHLLEVMVTNDGRRLPPVMVVAH